MRLNASNVAKSYGDLSIWLLKKGFLMEMAKNPQSDMKSKLLMTTDIVSMAWTDFIVEKSPCRVWPTFASMPTSRINVMMAAQT